MKFSPMTIALASVILTASGGGIAQAQMAKNPMVGYIAVNSKDHTTLVAAVKAAGLVDTLKSAGPFTVFAPTNAAFAKLPAGTVDTLLKPENKATLTGILTYHVVPGKMNAKDIAAKAAANGGKAVLTTAQGEPLTVWQKGKDWYVTDAKGGSAKITIADVNQSNGVIHVIDTVLMP